MLAMYISYVTYFILSFLVGDNDEFVRLIEVVSSSGTLANTLCMLILAPSMMLCCKPYFSQLLNYTVYIICTAVWHNKLFENLLTNRSPPFEICRTSQSFPSFLERS